MLHATLEGLTEFRSTLSARDRKRLDSSLTKFGEKLVRVKLLDGTERLKDLLHAGRISPLLFEWALACQDTNPELLAEFRELLSEQDRKRLTNSITKFGKELLHAELFFGSPERLSTLLAMGKIPPVLYQWALAVRDTCPPQREFA